MGEVGRQRKRHPGHGGFHCHRHCGGTLSGPLFKDGELKHSKLRFKNQPSCLTVNMNVPMPFLHCLSLVPFPSDAQIEDDLTDHPQFAT